MSLDYNFLTFLLVGICASYIIYFKSFLRRQCDWWMWWPFDKSMKFKRKTTYITSEDSNLGPIDYNRFDACNLLMDIVMNMVYSVFALVNYILDMSVFIMYDNGCDLQMKYLHHLVRFTLYNNICSSKTAIRSNVTVLLSPANRQEVSEHYMMQCTHHSHHSMPLLHCGCHASCELHIVWFISLRSLLHLTEAM